MSGPSTPAQTWASPSELWGPPPSSASWTLGPGLRNLLASLVRGCLSPTPGPEMACSARADPVGSQATRVLVPVVAARAPDPALVDLDTALVILGLAAAEGRETRRAAPPHSWPTPSPLFLGPGRTLVTPHLALAEVGGIQDSIPAVSGATGGLDLPDSGGTLGPSLAAFGGTPSLPPLVGWVTPGLSPADV